MKTHQIPVIAGDGIGPEIIAEGKKVLKAAAQKHQFDIEWIDLPFGTDYYLKTGKLLEDKDLDFLGEERAAASVMDAVKSVLKENKVKTPDLGGSASTRQVGDEIARRVLDGK